MLGKKDEESVRNFMNLLQVVIIVKIIMILSCIPIHKSPSALEDNTDNILLSFNIRYHCGSLTWSPGVVSDMEASPIQCGLIKCSATNGMGQDAGSKFQGSAKGEAHSAFAV